MSLEALIVVLTLLVITGLWIAAPFFDRSRQHAAESTQKQRDRLLLHYERALGNIRDLDEDYATGKIHPDAYAAEREQWVQRGIQILMALDEVSGKPVAETKPSSTADVERSIDNRIEAAVQAHRRQAAKTHQ
jgi:hypothetical protein